MRKITLIVACLLSAYVAQAENLIVNGDFETELTKETSDTGTEADLSKDGRFRNVWGPVANVTRSESPKAGSVPVTSGKWYMWANSNAHYGKIIADGDNNVLSMGANVEYGYNDHYMLYLLPEMDPTKKVQVKFRYKANTDVVGLVVSVTDGVHRVRLDDQDYSTSDKEDYIGTDGKEYYKGNEQFVSGLWSSKVFSDAIKTATQSTVIPTAEWQEFSFTMDLPAYYANLKKFAPTIEPHKATFLVLNGKRAATDDALEILIDDVSLAYEGAASIATTTTFDWNVSSAAGQLRLSNVAEGAQVVVRQISGQTIVEKVASATEMQLPLAAGMYLVTVDGQTAKAIVK